jgi:protein-disulfide isomerase
MGPRPLCGFAFLASLAVLGCRAQVPAAVSASSSQASVSVGSTSAGTVRPGVALSPQLARRIEVMIRSHAGLSPDYVIGLGAPTASEIPGYSLLSITFTAPGKEPRTAPFLVSNDGRTLAQFNKFDIGEDPMAKIAIAGRPGRGGPADAPVLIVSFDDLECPFCAEMNAMLFPAIEKRYKDQVRIVYRDFPLEEIHPWAKHAAVDANCLAAQTPAGYWDFVDAVHAHSADMAGPQKSEAKANQTLDKMTLDEGAKQKIDQPVLTACVLKQDASQVDASMLWAEGEPLRLNQAPVLFVNGEKVEGIVPVETLYTIIDRALVAAGRTPPPPVAAAPATPGS